MVQECTMNIISNFAVHMNTAFDHAWILTVAFKKGSWEENLKVEP